MRIIGLILTIGTLVFVSACTTQESTVEPTANTEVEMSATYRTLSIDELADIMAEENPSYTVVNVHIPYQGEIEGTDTNIAYNDMDALTKALPDKNAPIVLYCRSGSMSEEASRNLVDLGYTQVYDIPGGMNAWQSSGRELVNNQ